MYSIIKNVINSGRFDLSSMLKKIDTLWVQNDLTDDEHTELIELSQSKANPVLSYAPFQDQIDKLAEKIKALEDRVTHIEEGEPDDPPIIDEWSEFVQPTGAHDAYNIGYKITFNGEHYVCKMNGCVWSPTDYPQVWEKKL